VKRRKARGKRKEKENWRGREEVRRCRVDFWIIVTLQCTCVLLNIAWLDEVLDLFNWGFMDWACLGIWLDTAIMAQRCNSYISNKMLNSRVIMTASQLDLYRAWDGEEIISIITGRESLLFIPSTMEIWLASSYTTNKCNKGQCALMCSQLDGIQ